MGNLSLTPNPDMVNLEVMKPRQIIFTGPNLRKEREDRYMSQKLLAQRTGLTERTIQKLEGKDANPTLQTMEILGEELNVIFQAANWYKTKKAPAKAEA